MIERIIEIAEQSAFLNLNNNLLNIQLPNGQNVTVPIGEIQCLILANPAITITGALLAALAEAGAAVVVSDKNRLPIAMHLPLNGNYIQNERFRHQINAKLPLQKRLWQTIIQEKIWRQGELLLRLHGDDFGLLNLSEKVRSGDPDNIESRAAVIYWKNFWKKSFHRNRDAEDSNMLLNYGYAVLLSAFNREIVASGYLTQIGIWHDNEFNQFNLACDLMEPFRVIVDRVAFELQEGDKEFKRKMTNVLNYKTLIDGKHTTLDLAIRQYTKSIFYALAKGDEKLILFPEKTTQDEL